MAALLLLLTLTTAGPFEPPKAEEFGVDATPGARARYAESLALLQKAIEKDPADVASWYRLSDLLERFERSFELTLMVRGALTKELAPEARTAMRGLLGHLLVVEAGKFGWEGIVIVGPGFRRQQPQRVPAKAKKLYEEAVEHLRAAIRANPRSVRAREDLAVALLAIDRKANADEAARLSTEADALRLRDRRPRPKPVDRAVVVGQLRKEAAELEQMEDDPDHAAALLLRKRALVLDFCNGTIPFEYEPTIYGPVSLLAPTRMINTNLTRTYLDSEQKQRSVSPQHYPAPSARKLTIIAGLALDQGDAAAATLLALIRQENGALADAAVASLAEGKHPAAIKHLPRLLDAELLHPDGGAYELFGQRRLVKLAAALKLKEAAAVLAAYLREDTDLYSPLGLASVLGDLGAPEHVAALRTIAADPDRDIYFRRLAVGAIGKLQPEALAELPNEPALELALAAARYRVEPSDDLRGRILAGLGHEHEADDAARFCLDLDIREAIPALEHFVEKRRTHYAVEDIRATLNELKARVRKS